MTATSAPQPLSGRVRLWRRLTLGWTPFNGVAWTVVVVLAALSLIPLFTVLVNLFWFEGQLDLAPFREVLGLRDLDVLIIHTLLVVAGTTVFGFLVGAFLAWTNERTDARMGIVTDALPLIPFLLPAIAGAVGWLLLLAPRAGYLNVVIRWVLSQFGVQLAEGPFDIFSWYGLIMVYTIYAVPYAYLMISSGLRNVDPALEEQARLSGAGILTTIRRVTLPSIAPSLGAACLLLIWSGFILFSVPVILAPRAGIEILSVRIIRVLSFTYPPDTALALGLSVIIVLFVGVAWYLQSRLLRRQRYASVTGKGRKISRIELGRWKWPVRGAMLAYLVFSAVLPIMALVVVSLQGFWTADITPSTWGIDALRNNVLENSLTRRSLRNSVYLGVVGGFLGMAAVTIVSMRLARAKGPVARLADGAIKLPAVISNIVLAVGVLLAFAGPPLGLSGTLLILLIGYIVLYLPQGSVAADAAVGQVGPELQDAARVSGAGGGTTLFRVSLPIMTAGLVAGWALLFVRMVGDLTASAILASTRNPVVGLRILGINENGSFAQLAAVTTALTLITTIVVAFVLWFSRRKTRWGGSAG